MARRPLAAGAFAALLLVACSSDDGTPPTQGNDGGVDATSDVQLPGNDAAPLDATTDGPTLGCGEFSGFDRYTCSKDGTTRGKCPGDASLTSEVCARGCLRDVPPQDDVCMGTTSNFSCTGTIGTVKAADGDYYLTAFGCWVDASNTVHVDPADNCIPACFAKAKTAGLCGPNDTGPQCEEKVNWFVADSSRFGCLARLRVENPKNGKKVIVVVLDAGPACSVEKLASKAILDASGRVDDYLFGAQMGYSDKALVHVVEVDPSTPLGPVP